MMISKQHSWVTLSAWFVFLYVSVVDSKSTMFLNKGAEKCVQIPVLSGTDLKLKYWSPDLEPKHSNVDEPPKIQRADRKNVMSIDLHVKEHIYSPASNTKPRFLSNNRITSAEGEIMVRVNFQGAVDICFSTTDPYPRLFGFSLTFNPQEEKKEQQEGESSLRSQHKQETKLALRSLSQIRGFIDREKHLVDTLTQTTDDLEYAEHVLWEALDSAYNMISWAPFIKMPVVVILAIVQARHVISHLKKKFVI